MPTGNQVNIEVRGLEELKIKFAKLKRDLSKYMADAAVDATKSVILLPRGGGGGKEHALYPPETAANKAPEPFYIRGVGMQYKKGNSYKSEKLGSSFIVKKVGYGARIGNNASYAPYVIGDNQSRRMKEIGWTKLIDVAKENLDKIKKVFQVWIDKALKNDGLK